MLSSGDLRQGQSNPYRHHPSPLTGVEDITPSLMPRQPAW